MIPRFEYLPRKLVGAGNMLKGILSAPLRQVNFSKRKMDGNGLLRRGFGRLGCIFERPATVRREILRRQAREEGQGLHVAGRRQKDFTASRLCLCNGAQLHFALDNAGQGPGIPRGVLEGLLEQEFRLLRPARQHVDSSEIAEFFRAVRQAFENRAVNLDRTVRIPNGAQGLRQKFAVFHLRRINVYQTCQRRRSFAKARIAKQCSGIHFKHAAVGWIFPVKRFDQSRGLAELPGMGLEKGKLDHGRRVGRVLL
ncbi:MAG TPA: hypothetical protein VD713_05590 [Sphingomonadales bacterium]|nr:hypothetical protein [Sphingomonadales bacterium]